MQQFLVRAFDIIILWGKISALINNPSAYHQ